MTKEQFRQVARLLAKVKAEMENIMEGESLYNISRNDNGTMFFSVWEGDNLPLNWVEEGADVENGEIHKVDDSMWIEREEEF